MRVRSLLPRRSNHLPPGQLEIRAFPRFTDDPTRPAPATAPIELTIAQNGVPVRTLHTSDLDQYSHVEQRTDFHCVTTWTYRNAQWGGVRLRDVLDDVMGQTLPRYACARGSDRVKAIFLTEDLIADNVLLATHLDGEPLDRRHGAPLRLVSPDQYGYKNLKHLVELDFSDHKPASTLGAKEHLRARVAAEERHSSLPNWIVKPFYRLAIIPTALVAERALRRSG